MTPNSCMIKTIKNLTQLQKEKRINGIHKLYSQSRQGAMKKDI
jgi:hypothetical protein